MPEPIKDEDIDPEVYNVTKYDNNSSGSAITICWTAHAEIQTDIPNLGLQTM